MVFYVPQRLGGPAPNGWAVDPPGKQKNNHKGKTPYPH